MDKDNIYDKIRICQDILDELSEELRSVVDVCDDGSYLHDCLLVAMRNCGHIDMKLKVASDITKSS